MSSDALLAYVRAIHAQIKSEYGWPHMCKELLARGVRGQVAAGSGVVYAATHEGGGSHGCAAHGMVSALSQGMIVHSDCGSQYGSSLFQNTLRVYDTRSSMNRRGNCWGNAPTENLWGSLKVARLHAGQLTTQRAAMDEVMDWLCFYNAHRGGVRNFVC
jgi:transposase InsO family protein